MQQVLNAQPQQTILSQALAEAHQQHSHVKLSKSLQEGRPADINVQTSIDNQVDLIVWGS